MKSIQIELPDKLAQELDAIVELGWFSNEAEVVRLAFWSLFAIIIRSCSNSSSVRILPGRSSKRGQPSEACRL